MSTEMKSQLHRLAEREQITESALVRQLLETVLRTSGGDGESTVDPPAKVSRDVRLSVRLAPDDRLLLTERATARDMAAATYVSVLVRSHLRGLLPLPKEELLALKRSVAELSAIGRNLNQIARVANQGGRTAAVGSDHIRAMLKVSEGLRDHIKAFLRANERSWRCGYADAPD
ncbi:MAG TPA: MobC family plasmid mobilization relaxosome protein [Steroidobacteraceae bacterium]|nr:MobC family plasmid mobilization relaxosome protein [Steroidobacteraceae bacterium]